MHPILWGLEIINDFLFVCDDRYKFTSMDKNKFSIFNNCGEGSLENNIQVFMKNIKKKEGK